MLKSAKILNSEFSNAKIVTSFLNLRFGEATMLKCVKILNAGFWKAKIFKSAKILN